MKKNPSRNVHFSKEPSTLLDKINTSIDVDQRLFKEDIIIETLAARGFSAVSGGGITVGLTLELVFSANSYIEVSSPPTLIIP